MEKVVGITGTIASGKDTVKKILQSKFNCYTVSLSSIIKAELEKKKNKNFSRKNLQDLGNELRKKYGTHILAMLAVEYLQRDKELIIIDGIRNPGEVDFLRKKFGNKFVLIGVDANPEIRFERIKKRGNDSDPKTWEEFLEIDKRDQGENEPEYGQKTKECLEKADFLIINDSTLEDLEKKVNEIAEKIKNW
ncbi:MAG: AAA family ATPase [Candidatus Aenigmatarchaeota archaeon]